ncbi:MAG: cytochrome c [Mariniphaga sp.]
MSLLITILLGSQGMMAQDGVSLFKACAACHSIGKGRMVGPDLKGVTKRRTHDWIIRFVQSPSKVMKSGDAGAVAIFKEFNNLPMPDNTLSVDQINQILDFIDGGKTGSEAVDPAQAVIQHRADSLLNANSSQDIVTGNELFNGVRRFENGGASCNSCHNATYNKASKGGILAKNLTKVYSRLGGFAGIKGIIASPPFPSMTETYKNRPLTDDEMAFLMLFLKATDAQNPNEPLVQKTWFLYTGLTSALLMVLAIIILWFKRKRKSVNHDIIKRQERYSK